MEHTTLSAIEKTAGNIRKQILKIALDRGGCYLAQACSSAEIVATLYMEVLNLGPSQGAWRPAPFPGVPGPDNMDYQKGALYNGLPSPDRDRLFVSCCHYASVIYSALAATGRICPDCMDKFNVDGWNMEMIGAEHSPGFENTAGSLGQTISIAAGTAHARKRRAETGRVFCLVGDGELQEGQTWECIQAASYYKLDNFVVVVDANGQQVEGAVDQQMALEPLAARFSAFGAECVTCNGHAPEEIAAAANAEHAGKPLVILCRTRGTTGVPPLEKRWPHLHFVRISDVERAEFQAVYEGM